MNDERGVVGTILFWICVGLVLVAIVAFTGFVFGGITPDPEPDPGRTMIDAEMQGP